MEIAGVLIAVGLAAAGAFTWNTRGGAGKEVERLLAGGAGSRYRPIARAAETIQRGWAGFAARWSEIAGHPYALGAACTAGLAMHAMEVATIVCAGRAVGAEIGAMPVAASYVAANLAAIVSFLPGGAGFFEAAMIATLCTAGHITLAHAVAVVAIYRLLSIWLPAPALAGLLRQPILPNGTR
jgi:uncharacterized protein (TIRG00374 family)